MFGSRGILRDQDIYRKQREFEAWMREVKMLPNFHGTKADTLEYFRTFAEDYNTCTLPHEKFYDLEKWELEEKARKEAGGKGGGSGGGGSGGNMNLFGEADSRREEAAALAKAKEAEKMALFRASLGADRMAQLKKQAELQAALQYAFKSGNTKEAERIKRLLEPVE